MRIDRNLKLIGRFTFCVNLLFHLPVLVPFYGDHIGLTYRDFLLGEAAWAAAIVLFDVPTGWISDIGRRTYTLAFGVFFNLLGYCYLMMANDLMQVLVAQALIGAGFSVLSVTQPALLYDSLLSEGREAEYRKQEGRRQALSFYAIAVASVAGGFLYSMNAYLPLALTIIVDCMALITAFMIDEPLRRKRRAEKHPLADIAETLRLAARGHPEIVLLILFSAVMFCSMQLILWSQQPYYMAMGLPKSDYGILIALGFGLGGIASHLSHRFDGKVPTFRALFFAWIAAVSGCIGAGMFISWIGVVMLIIGGSCLLGVLSPRVTEAINQLVGSERRATILSTQSVMAFLLFIPTSAGAGWVSGKWGIQTSLLAIALWLCVAGICLGGWQLLRRYKSANS